MKSYDYARYVFAVLCLVGLLAASLYFSPSASSQRKLDSDPQISRSLSRYDVLELDAPSVLRQVRQTSRLRLETSEGVFDIVLAPHDMRAANYRAVAVGEGGAVRELGRDEVRTYKGTLVGIEGAQARLTIDEGVVEGMIITRDHKYFVEPASRYSDAAGKQDFLLYKETDIIHGATLECAVPTMAGKVNAEVSRVSSSVGSAVQANAVSPKRIVQIATDADFEYYQAFSNSEQAAKNEILSIMNQVDAIYENEIGLTFEVVFQRVFTTPNDPYTAGSLSGLLDEVRAQWRDNPPTNATRDLVHMWTGRDLDFTQAGLAYTIQDPQRGVVCRSLEYSVGISERQTAAPQKYTVTAHEIGHNFSATHPETDGRAECALTIMSGISQTNTVATFCQYSRDQIESYINFAVNSQNNCLEATQTLAQFSQSDYRVNEGDRTIQITVSRPSGQGASTVFYQTLDGTANDRADYTTALGVLRFAAGETTKSFTVFITDDRYGVNTKPFTDSTSEAATETVVLMLTQNEAGGATGLPFLATLTITDNDGVNGANPVKDPTFSSDFFVRQHYIDFFNREADAGGLSFWRNQIDECTTQACREVRRINVSAAFFVSIEYQETGYFAIRIQRAAFGRRSNQSNRMGYRELVRDQRQIGEGVVIGQPGAEANLEANKQAYATQVASSADFNARFPQTTADAYVDALFASAGVTPTASERQAAIAAYGSGGAAGRAAALRKVAESASVNASEINPAFVLLQYHGYLRRDPNASPDSDDSGYQFWLGKLNQFGGNYVTAEMVKGFITSGEYIRRFGPE
ncbi:MAG TPA: M12 family metallo-peptidase [Pyrinomonadaceae bacterium]|jgi:hypothetical protein